MATLIVLTAEPDNFVPKRLKEEAEKLKIETEIINPSNCYVSICADSSYISHEGTKFLGAEYCIPRLSEDNLEYKIAIMDHLEQLGVKMLNTGAAMRNCSNKILTQILLSKEKIETPKTAVITNDEQLKFAVESVGGKYPVIIKTLFGTHGVGVIRVDSEPSLKSVAQQLLKSQCEFLIQEFIEHDSSSRIYILGDDVLAAVNRDIPDGDFRSNAHQGAKLKTYEPSEQEIEISKKAAKAVGANFAAVDFITVDDKIIILEVNGSPGFESLQEVTDKNIAEHIIKWISNDDNKAEIDTDDKNSNVTVTDIPDEEFEEEEDKKEDKEESAEHRDKEEKEAPKGEIEVDPEIPDRDDIIGTITHAVIKFVNDNKPIEARVDTGATHSSLNADHIEVTDNSVKFRFGEYVYKFPLYRISKIKTTDNGDAEDRPVIKVDMVLNNTDIKNAEITLNDRKHMQYDLLLGRSTLSAAGVLINPAAHNLDSEQPDSEQKKNNDSEEE